MILVRAIRRCGSVKDERRSIGIAGHNCGKYAVLDSQLRSYINRWRPGDAFIMGDGNARGRSTHPVAVIGLALITKIDSAVRRDADRWIPFARRRGIRNWPYGPRHTVIFGYDRGCI